MCKNYSSFDILICHFFLKRFFSPSLSSFFDMHVLWSEMNKTVPFMIWMLTYRIVTLFWFNFTCCCCCCSCCCCCCCCVGTRSHFRGRIADGKIFRCMSSQVIVVVAAASRQQFHENYASLNFWMKLEQSNQESTLIRVYTHLDNNHSNSYTRKRRVCNINSLK